MRMKIAVIDLELSRRTKRALLWVGLPFAIIITGGAVAYSSGATPWTAGQQLKAADLNAAFAAVAIPPGTVVAFAGSAVPNGWLLCDGSSVKKADYAALYAAIQTASGGSSDAFNLPDYRGMFLRGLDASGKVDPDVAGRVAAASGGNLGPLVGSYQADAFASHTHVIEGPNQWLASSGSAGPYGIEPNFSGHATANTDPTGGSETRPKNVAVNYIIKY